jgi:glycosyltransferase involved in cell wall biosynthesis/extradiol dioxygenase family protein
MRVLVLSTDKSVFTPESAVARRFRLMAGAVERLDVIVPHGPGNLVSIAGNSAARGFGLGKFAGFWRTLAAGLRLERPDVVSVQDPFLIGFLGLLIAGLRGAKLNVQVHTDIFDPNFANASLSNRIKLLLARFVLACADSVRVVNESIRTHLKERGVKAEISVLPVFIDPERIRKAAPLNRAQKYPHFKKLVLSVSRLETEKGVDDTLRVMKEILKDEPEAGLVVLGSGSEKQHLVLLAQELGLGERVVFEDYQDPFPYFKAADVLLVTSRYEGYGMAIVEALALGCPVVSLDVGIAGEAGAIVTDLEHMPKRTLEVLKSGARGRLSFALPDENEYRDLWHAQMVVHTTNPMRAQSVDAPPQSDISHLNVGFVGQGWIGKNYADELERRGFKVTRYSLEEPYVHNKELIKECDVVFVAVPTPTTLEGFDDSYVQSALQNVGEGKTAVIKSTIIPGTTKKMQDLFPGKYILHSPEFLVEATASYDAAHPTRNIVGIPEDSPEFRQRAEVVLRLLPPAPFELISTTRESELIKYINNVMLAMKVVNINLVYDLAQELHADYALVRDAIGADPRIGRSHLDPVHKSGHKGAKPGRGAGGDCFIKDFEAFRRLYAQVVGDAEGNALLDATMNKNLHLLLSSGKDITLIKSVYGEDIEKKILGR